MRITREIGIDMGHRVTNHGSKCRNLHGHRYRIVVTLEGGLFTEGASEGMVLDFGFVKNLMMDHIDLYFDHGMALWVKDPLLAHELGPTFQSIRENCAMYGFVALKDGWRWGKLVVTQDVPTAENLAKLWAYILKPYMERDMEGTDGRLHSVTVWETPNCSATYVLPVGGVGMFMDVDWAKFENRTAADLADDRV
jgi:6-pyruvoyl-tetrahydropterin synthase